MIEPTSSGVATTIATLVFLITLVSSTAKFTNAAMIQRRWTGQLGMPDGLRIWVGVIELVSGSAFLSTNLMFGGAIGLTAYLGGAIALHARVRIMSVCVYAALLIALIWLSVYWRI